MELRKAMRQQAKMRLGLSAVSGGGKTYSAIQIAKGLVGDLSKVAIIDTENGSADLYAHLGDYNVLPITDFSPENYINAIHYCEKAGIECIVIDSITHEWEWCVDEQARLGGRYNDWAKVTPRHDSFKKAILNSPCHIITTVRRKQDYDISKDGNGKAKIEKVGLKEVTRDGWDYELTVNLEIDIMHFASALKDRTGLFIDKPSFIPSEETGKLIKEWCDAGVTPIATPKSDAEVKDQIRDRQIKLKNDIEAAKTADAVRAIWDNNPDMQANNKFEAMIIEKINQHERAK